VTITAAARATIDRHARAESPRECCGLLLGRDTDILKAEPTRNLADTATRYLIDPEDHFRILKQARTEGQTIIGAYHSHPASAPVPSPTDLADGLPNFLYIIARPHTDAAGSDMRAYWLEGQSWCEVPLHDLE
jgi:proteasome lid subunit RPN8/RPN11